MSRSPSLFVRILDKAVFAFFIFVAVWLLMRLLVHDAVWWVALFNKYVWQLLLLPGVLALLWLLWRRDWVKTAVSAILLGGIFIWLYGPLFWPNGVAEANGRSLTAMTYNIKFDHEDSDAMIDTIRAADADIVGLQEVIIRHTRILEEELSEQYPYRVFAQPENRTDVALLSKYPVSSVERLALPPREMAIHAVLDVDGEPVHVIVTHLMPDQLGSLNGQPLPQRLRERLSIRSIEVTQLFQTVTALTEPVLLLCDCNFTETTQVYGLMDRALDDTFREVGWGFGLTNYLLSNRVRSQRIDYIWHSAAFTAVDVTLLPPGSSDHRPVLATLALGE